MANTPRDGNQCPQYNAHMLPALTGKNLPYRSDNISLVIPPTECTKSHAIQKTEFVNYSVALLRSSKMSNHRGQKQTTLTQT
jgi:hypothetical protein